MVGDAYPHFWMICWGQAKALISTPADRRPMHSCTRVSPVSNSTVKILKVQYAMLSIQKAAADKATTTTVCSRRTERERDRETAHASFLSSSTPPVPKIRLPTLGSRSRLREFSGLATACTRLLLKYYRKNPRWQHCHLFSFLG